MSFKTVSDFENEIATWFGSPYGVAVDCCTHGIELCLRYQQIECITIPKRTYLSVPFLADKLGIELRWKNEHWEDYYKNYDEWFIPKFDRYWVDLSILSLSILIFLIIFGNLLS